MPSRGRLRSQSRAAPGSSPLGTADSDALVGVIDSQSVGLHVMNESNVHRRVVIIDRAGVDHVLIGESRDDFSHTMASQLPVADPVREVVLAMVALDDHFNREVFRFCSHASCPVQNPVPEFQDFVSVVTDFNSVELGVPVSSVGVHVSSSCAWGPACTSLFRL